MISTFLLLCIICVILGWMGWWLNTYHVWLILNDTLLNISEGITLLDCEGTSHRSFSECEGSRFINHPAMPITSSSQLCPQSPRPALSFFHSTLCVLSHFSRVQHFVTPWTIACQSPLSTGFSRQEHWSGLPFPPGDLPDPGIEPTSLLSPALAGRFFTISTT